MSNSNLNPPPNLDPDQLTRLLELELAHKRTEWQRASSRARNARMNAFVFLFVLMAGCAFAFFFLFSQVSGERPSHRASPSPAAQSQPRH